jgi:uncharacterized membrane protein (UPF0127 family)
VLRHWLIASLVSLSLLLPLCIFAQDRLIEVQLPRGGIIHAEIADTPKKRAEGLMYRKYLAKDRGMLFIFGQAQLWTFWMKNTQIPLDIIWMDEKKQIIHIARSTPICTRKDDGCPQYQPNDPALYVLELGSGEADRLKLENGSKLKFQTP